MRSSKVLLPFLLGISPVLAVATVGMMVPEVAWAQTPVFSGAGLIELLPPVGIVGDGATANDVFLLALGPDGKPVLGLKLKASASAGTATDPAELGGGVYRISFTAGKVTTPSTASITLKGKVGSVNFSQSWNIPVAPPRGRSLAIAANPPQVVLGQDSSASISFTVAGGDNTADLAVLSSVGTVANVTPLGNGQYSALYTPPAQGFPQLAVLRVVDKRDPTRSYGTFALPLVGKTNYPVNVQPNGRAVIRIADKTYGPVQADATGRAYVPIFVPPGVPMATLVSINVDNTTQEAPLDLRIPESKRLAMLPGPMAVPADGRLAIPLRAVVYTADGKPDGNATVAFTTSAGQVSAARHEGGGIYVATWTPPTSPTNGSATVSVALTGGSPLQADGFTMNMVGARPVKVEVAAEPSTLPIAADSFRVSARVIGPDGQGIAGRNLEFSANGAKIKGEVKDGKNGEYSAVFSTTGPGGVELSAVVTTPPVGNALDRVIVLPARQALPADGLSSNALTVVTVDEYGYPVANVTVNLAVKKGDGALPTTVTTGPNGTAMVYYTAGRASNFVAIEAVAASGITGATGFVQSSAAVSLPPLPVSGELGAVKLVNEWAGSRVDVRINREQPAVVVPPPAAPVPAGLPGGKASKLAVASDVPTAVPGGMTTIRVTATDDQGRPVSGQVLEFMVSAGSMSPAQEVGPGVYQATLSVPAGHTGEVKVSAATPDGSASGFMKLPVGAAMAVGGAPADAWGAPAPAPAAWGAPAPAPAAWGAPAPAPAPAAWGAPAPAPAPAAWGAPAPAPAPAAWGAPAPIPAPAPAVVPAPAPVVATPPPPKTPKEVSDRPFLRIGVGYALDAYKYSQERLNQSSSLYKLPINMPTSIAQGGGINARFFVPGFRYVGVDAGLRANVYSVAPQALCEGLGQPCPSAGAIADQLLNVHVLAVGRYVVDVGSTTIGVGARIGYGGSTVRTWSVPDATSIDPGTLFISGLGLGAEVTADIGPKFGVGLNFTEYLAGGSTPYNSELGLDLTYSLTDFLYLGLGYEFQARNIELSENDAPSGEIKDSSHVAKLGVGVQF